MIDNKDINPMDWYNTKFLSYIPKHFVRVKFRHHAERTKVLSWIEQNTVGRFGIEAIIDANSPQHSWAVLSEEFQIGFEDPAEATMYTMFFR